MNTPSKPVPVQQLLAAGTIAMLLGTAPAHAGPDAHGPGGEHLDAVPTLRAASAQPRVEAHSEAFELVAELRASEMAILVDRYESNEPVLGAKLEVESGSLKAVAAFRAEHGDYVVTDAALLKALAAAGEHGLVFTLVAGPESDLLDGTLVGPSGRAATAAAPDGRAHSQAGDDLVHRYGLQRAPWIGAGVAVLGLLGGVVWWRRRRRTAGSLQGGL